MTLKTTLTAIVVFTVLFVLTTTVAAANPADEYRAAMRHFLPVIEDWSDQLQSASRAAAVKPSPERVAVVQELASRGNYILDDLRGTAALAPQPLMTAHWQLADAVGTMVAAAETVQADPKGAAAAVDAQVEFAAPALERIWNFVTLFGLTQPVVVPARTQAGG